MVSHILPCNLEFTLFLLLTDPLLLWSAICSSIQSLMPAEEAEEEIPPSDTSVKYWITFSADGKVESSLSILPPKD